MTTEKTKSVYVELEKQLKKLGFKNRRYQNMKSIYWYNKETCQSITKNSVNNGLCGDDYRVSKIFLRKTATYPAVTFEIDLDNIASSVTEIVSKI